jgi:hypothetical protein
MKTWFGLPVIEGLHLLHVDCLRALGTAFHFKADALTFAQRTKASPILDDSTVVDENISLIAGLDKTIPLLVVEPLDSALGHCCFLS